MTASNLYISSAVRSIVDRIREGAIQNIVVLTGAGISCAAGIPDLRSPGGLYQSLRPEIITANERERSWMRSDPTAVVNIDLFSRNQFPYLEVRRPFIIGTAKQEWKATLSHFSLKILEVKGFLRRIYTQNIDGLELQLGLRKEYLVHVHGSLAEIKCEFCGAPYPQDSFSEEVTTKIKNIYDESDPAAPQSSSHIHCLTCLRPGVKPDTVMYGSQLPSHYWKSVKEDFPDQVDLMLVVGTSLTVAPACNLVTLVGPLVPRLLINNEMVGGNMGLDFGPPVSINSNMLDDLPRDGCIIGNCDEAFLYLLGELGWVEDLQQYRSFLAENSAKLLS